MIVKNESHIIEETLNNIKKYIDYWVICDTGSTDDTKEKIKKFFKKAKIKGEFFNHVWKDFGYNRTIALKEAYNKSDYIWVIDADDLIEGNLVLPTEMTADGYMLKFGKDFEYKRLQIFKNRGLIWQYKAKIHEFPECINKNNLNIKLLEGDYYINSRRLGERSKDPEKYLKDAELSVRELKNDPELQYHYCFNAAQSYSDYGDYVRAIYYYKEFIKMQNENISNDYSFNAHFRIAILLRYLNKSNDEIIKAYEKVIQNFPDRAEPLYELGLFYKQINDNENSYKYIKRSSELEIPQKYNQLFKNIYEYKAKYQLAVLSYNEGRYDESFMICNKLLQNSNFNKQVYDTIEILKYNNVLFLKHKFIVYNERIINMINKYMKLNQIKKGKSIACVIIINDSSTEKILCLLNSFIQCCTDILLIDKWICYCKENDKLIKLYPFINYHTEIKLEEMIDADYIIYLDDNWQFFEKRDYIKPAIKIMQGDDKIGQVLFNKNYITTINQIIEGGELITKNGISYRIHVYHKEDSEEYMNKIKTYSAPMYMYWPHWALRPGVINTKVWKKIGFPDLINSENEINYANTYANHYITAFYDTVTCFETNTNNTNKINNNIKFNIALLIPSTTKNRNWNGIESSYIYNIFLPHFMETRCLEYNYTIYLGYDNDDEIYNKKEEMDKIYKFIESYSDINLKIIKFEEKLDVTKMWNILFKYAYDDNNDYFYQCGDDIKFCDQYWVSKCIEILRNNNNIGAYGPIDKCNEGILTQSFVSRKHMHIFNYYFPEEIKNWFCDNWITEIYAPNYMNIFNDYKCYNQGGSSRYQPEIINKEFLDKLISRDKCKIANYLEKMKKIISFSLWGSHPLYTYGAIENALLAKDIYPGWICRFYYNDSVPFKIINALKDMTNTELIKMNAKNNASNAAWRFRPLFENDVDIMISRDTDSRLNIRESEAVAEWLNSAKDFHIMRDHPYHKDLILAGMFGCRRNILHSLKKTFEEYDFNHEFGIDQLFLKEKIYEFIKNNVFVHDNYFNYEECKKSFNNNNCNNYSYVGEIIHDISTACKYLNEPIFEIKDKNKFNNSAYRTLC